MWLLLFGPLGLLNETSQVLHLLSSGFWLGSLLPLLSAAGSANIVEFKLLVTLGSTTWQQA